MNNLAFNTNGGNLFSGIGTRLSKLGNTISQNAQNAVKGISSFSQALQNTTNPATKQAQLAQDAKKSTTSGMIKSSVIPTVNAATTPVKTTTPVSTPKTTNTNQGGMTPEQQRAYDYAASLIPKAAEPTTPVVQTPPLDQFNQATSGLINIGQGQNNDKINAIAQQIASLDNENQQKSNNINQTAGFLTQANGEQGLLRNQYLTARDALTNQLQTAQTAQGQQISALQGAAGLIPEALRYGNSGGNLSPQSQADQLAQLVISGQLSPDKAQEQMGSYGLVGNKTLRDSILKLNPNYNFNLGTSSAQTQATGQQISAALPPATQALDALQGAFNNLGALSGSSIPFVQEFSQNAAMQTGIGRTAVSNFQGALQEARARINAVLTGIIGVDAAGRQANALLPDNMTPQELPTKIAAAKQYLQNQLQSYTNSGNQNQSSNSTSGFNW